MSCTGCTALALLRLLLASVFRPLAQYLKIGVRAHAARASVHQSRASSVRQKSSRSCPVIDLKNDPHSVGAARECIRTRDAQKQCCRATFLQRSKPEDWHPWLSKNNTRGATLLRRGGVRFRAAASASASRPAVAARRRRSTRRSLWAGRKMGFSHLPREASCGSRSASWARSGRLSFRGRVIGAHTKVIQAFVDTSDSPFGCLALEKLFEMADLDGDGTIDRDELEKALKKLGFYHLSGAQLDAIMKRADEDDNSSRLRRVREGGAQNPEDRHTLVKLAKNNGAELGFLSLRCTCRQV